MHLPPVLADILRAAPTDQRSFSWKPEPWRAKMHDLPEVLDLLDRLPSRVDRDTTRTTVLTEFDAGRVLPAFVAAMVWGYGAVGYGPSRVRWVFTGTRGADALQAPVLPTVTESLTKGAHIAREDGPLDAYRYLYNDGRIKFLGGAFFTKWLYFVSAVGGPNDPAAAPILDKQVANWLRENAGVDLRVDRTSSYEAYLGVLSDWGEPYGRSRVEVEKAIFGLATGRD